MELLKKAYNQENYLTFLAEKFKFTKNIADRNIEDNEVDTFQELGTVTTQDGKKLPVFEIHIKPNTKLQRNRVKLRNLVAKQIQTEDGALAVYVDDENNQWRFSFIAIEHKLTEGVLSKEETASKRFTYLLGENTKTKTAETRFGQLNKQSTLADLKQVFSVETLSKEFYGKLYKWYEKAQKQVTFPNDEKAKNHPQTSLIRLLTRLLFIWFLKEKKLINADLFKENKLKTLIDYEKPSSFYKAILQNLFFATLSTEIKNREFRTETEFQGKNEDYGNQYRYRYHGLVKDKEKWEQSFSKTPFLNGGLFESLDRKASETEKQDYDNDPSIRPEKIMLRMEGFSEHPKNPLKILNHLFFNNDEQDLGLIDLFNQYQFTVEESTPLDIEVALDPELLGKVFENLLASYNPETGQQARKATGSFYTPREIVSYMVDESLKQHFKQHTDLDKKQIQYLFADESETENTLDKEQIDLLILAIFNIKILDPAVGSGAFPMGILQRLVLILEKIDPENIYFKHQHNAYGKKLYLIENCIYGVDIQPIAIQICKLRFFISLTIEQTPNDDENDNYGIKALPNLETRFIVANTLLPLGEMPKQLNYLNASIAELQKQLAKVRHKYFSAKTLKTKSQYKEEDEGLRKQIFIELITKYDEGENAVWMELKHIVLSKISKLEKNKNTCEIKINVAKQYTLLPIEKPENIPVKENYLLNKISQLRELIAEENLLLKNIFEKNNSVKTAELWNEAKRVVEKNKPLIHARLQKIVDWDLYNQNAEADWFDPQWQFGVKEGFDIVIGNPPYRQIKWLNYKRLLEKGEFDTFSKTADIYCLFYERANKILKASGIGIHITSNKWLRSDYGKQLRNYLINNANAIQLIDFVGYKVFETATVDTNILHWKSEPYKGITKTTVIDNAFRNKNTISDFVKSNYVNNSFLLNNQWLSLSKIELKIKELIELNSKRLSEIVNLNYGILTGDNKVFLIDAKTYKFLISQDLKNKNIIKPILRGKDLEQYSYKFNNVYLINSHNGIKSKNIPPINIPVEYPTILTYFEFFGKHFKNRGEQGDSWYNLRNCAYLDEFNKDKIIYADIVQERGRFCYDTSGFYTNDTAFIITGKNLKFLTAILNSKIVSYSYKKFYSGGGLGNKGIRFKKGFLGKIPIPQISKPEQKPFIDLVDKIIKAKQQAEDTTVLEAQIDQMVYKLYNLTDDEIKIIEEIK